MHSFLYSPEDKCLELFYERIKFDFTRIICLNFPALYVVYSVFIEISSIYITRSMLQFTLRLSCMFIFCCVICCMVILTRFVLILLSL